MIFRSLLLQRLAIAAGCMAVLLVASGFSSCNGSNSLFGGNFGAVVVNPQSISLNCSAPSHTFTATQVNYQGGFSAVSADTAQVMVAPTVVPGEFNASVGSNATGVPTVVTVTGGGGMTGTTTVTAVGCPCVRHHDMWDACPLKRGGTK